MSTTKITHKTLGITISYSEYISLPESERINFKFVESQETKQVVNNSTTVNKVSNNTSDLLGIGTVAACAVTVPLLIIDSLFDL